ncbi:hypothetical protein CU097_011634 [Rhizopus azygosporus]|uniref:Uncharacterized protein n=2 Tax=Rhizopus TaxID=4842 RepID=A0A367JGQ6_RHIAZ|nr:hypothetical protein BCV71DRAFT_55055 [Rhizopus microsporus]RCH89076.1 hypothetical protein CU097_011634 [Rhizopus azygosporus]CEI86184.1 hypothetical protein RMCBS344292_00628 [Rhizopus microsporus]
MPLKYILVAPEYVKHFKDVKAIEFHFYMSHQELLLDQTAAAPQQQSNSTHQERARKLRSNSNDTEKSMENELIDASSLSFLSSSDYEHLMIGNFDVTDALYLLQRSILQQKWKFSLEDHVHCAIAINSILLLTPNIFP